MFAFQAAFTGGACVQYFLTDHSPLYPFISMVFLLGVVGAFGYLTEESS